MKRRLAASKLALALALAGCNDRYASSGKSLSPIPPDTMALMASKGMEKSDPILVRLYKKESELQVWKKAHGKYALLKTFPICRWSGQLGPKVREGDRQAPEGFYAITPGQMNPNSAYYLSFNTGYPNAYDRAHGRTGAQLMVHGTCSSMGCYAMTDDEIGEVYALARESFNAGQKEFQFQAYPFKMTAENLAKYRFDPNMPFWKNLKEGSDHFAITGREPKVAVCGGRYAFDTVGNSCSPDPTLAPVVAEKEQHDRQEVAALVAKGVPAVKLVYADGGQNDVFRETALAASSGDAGTNYSVFSPQKHRNLGDVSRPEALAQGPREVPIDASGRMLKEGASATQLAAAEPSKPHAKTSSRSATPTRLAAAKTGSDTKAVEAVRPPRVMVANADPDAPIPSAVRSDPAGDKPFYERMLGDVFGGEIEAKPSVSTAATASTHAETAPTPPLVKPPHRHSASASSGRVDHVAVAPRGPVALGPAASAQHAAKGSKPEATAPERHVEAGLIPGAQAVGPSSSSFKAN